MRCPSCQAPIRPEDTFCGSCGYRLTQQDRVSSVPASPPEQPSAFPPMPGPPPIQIQSYPSPAQQVQVVQPTYDQAPPTAAPQPAYQVPQMATPPYGQMPQAAYGPAPQPAYGQAPPQAYRPKKKGPGGCIIALIVAAALLLCGAVIVGGIFLLPEILPQATPTAAPYQPPTDSGSALPGTEVVLDVVNNLDVAVCYLYISSSDSDDWGGDWLEEMGTIPPGTTATFSIVAGDTVDIRVEDCDGATIDEQYGVYVPPEGLTYTLNP